MMEWFVIYNSEHLGPFSETVLHQLYKEGDVKEETLVWSEGMDDPVSYRDQFILEEEELDFRPLEEVSEKVEQPLWFLDEKEDDDNVPPPLPIGIVQAEPVKEEPVTVETQLKVAPVALPTKKPAPAPVQESQTVEEIQIPVVKETIEAPVTQEDNMEPEEYLNHLVDDEIIAEAEKIEKESKRNKSFLFVGIFVFFVVLVPGVLYIKNTYLTFSRPALMSMGDYERLVEVSKDPTFTNKFAVALGQERARVWMATNLPYEGEVILKLKSIQNKTLTNTEVEAMARGYLKGKIVQFDEWTFSKGVKLVDGYYHVEAHTTRDLEVPFVFKLYPARKTQFRFFDELLISQLSKDEFNEALGKTKKELTRNDLEFWKELKQKYKTIKMITLQIKTEMDRAFDSTNVMWIEELKKFESKYKKEFGAFFTNFVIQNDQSYEKLKSKKFSNKLEIISNYNRLSRLAKDIGKVSMDVFHEMETFDGIDDARKEVIRKRADQQLDEIIKTCDQKISIIQTY